VSTGKKSNLHIIICIFFSNKISSVAIVVLLIVVYVFHLIVVVLALAMVAVGGK
jgi:hypothetical protein